MKLRPRWIFLENVQGFSESNTLKILKEVLRLCNYRIKQYMLSPSILGIPNRRMRYYLTACHCSADANPLSDDYDTIYNTINGEDKLASGVIQNYVEEMSVHSPPQIISSLSHSLIHLLTLNHCFLLGI